MRLAHDGGAFAVGDPSEDGAQRVGATDEAIRRHRFPIAERVKSGLSHSDYSFSVIVFNTSSRFLVHFQTVLDSSSAGRCSSRWEGCCSMFWSLGIKRLYAL